MILIDALYLNSPGGVNLLKYLYTELRKRGIISFFLLDKRTENDLAEFITCYKTFLISNLRNRKQFYLKHKTEYSSVLCFSNIPPPISLDLPVYTLFHNILLLQDCHYYSIKPRILFYLKRLFISHFKNNSKTWIVQTGFMKQLLIKKLGLPGGQIEVLPFFNLAVQIEPLNICKNLNSFIYPSTGLSHKNHAVLLKAWDLLFQEGYNFELHLTIPESDIKLIRYINYLKSRGLNIINHGVITHHNLLSLYKLIEYLVYPSLNESFGLPLLEAVQQNCKIITADLPYSREAIIPTAIFNPYRPSSLKSAILQAISQKGIEKKSVIITENKIDSFIELINKHNYK